MTSSFPGAHLKVSSHLTVVDVIRPSYWTLVHLDNPASVRASFARNGLPETTVTTVAQAIWSERRRCVEFMMKVELGVDKPDSALARVSALTIALSYVSLRSGLRS